MVVKLRLKRMGRRHRPFFRVVAADSRCPRDGNVIEELGFYDPIEKNKDARVKLNTERLDDWLDGMNDCERADMVRDALEAMPAIARRTVGKYPNIRTSTILRSFAVKLIPKA